MILFTLCIGTALGSLFFTLKAWKSFRSRSPEPDAPQALLFVSQTLQTIEETFASGLIPSAVLWNRLEGLYAPWGTSCSQSIQGLRAQGGAIVPTLRRFRTLAQDQHACVVDARARCSQALAQAMACLFLVPLLGGLLSFMMPGLSEASAVWFRACLIAFAFSALGAAQVNRLAGLARWGGLTSTRRTWPLWIQIGGERFLSLIRSGVPPDLAWAQSAAVLGQCDPDLLPIWGGSLWEKNSKSPPARARAEKTALEILRVSLENMRRAVQNSLLEGMPAGERVESCLLSLRTEWRARQEREVNLVGTRSLKPLYIFVAPSVLGLLGFGLFLCGTAALER